MIENVIGSSTSYNVTITVKHVLSGHLEIDKTMVLMENGGLMKVESTFDLH